MAIANLHETLLCYTLRKSQLNLEISELQTQKSLALLSQADTRAIKAQDEHEIREFYKALYEGDSDYQGKYKDYTQIPDFEAEMDKIAAKYQEELEQINAMETQWDNEITTKSAELEEINAYMESMKSMLSSNIQEDFKFGLN